MQIQTKLVLLISLFSMSKAYVFKSSYPLFAPCDEKIISGIKALWNFTGIPTGVLAKLEKEGQFSVHQTSYDYLNFGNKCVYMDASKDNSTLTFTFIPKLKVMPPGVITYNIKEDTDGSLYDEEKNMRWYTVLLGHGLEVNYVCSVKGGIPVGLPLGSIFISKKNVDNINESILNIPRAILADWGIRFIYNYSYSSSCFY